MPNSPRPHDFQASDTDLAERYRQAQLARLLDCFEHSAGRPAAGDQELARWYLVHRNEVPVDDWGKIVPLYPAAH